MSCLLTGRALRNALLEVAVPQGEWLCPAQQSAALEGDDYAPAPGTSHCYIEKASGDIYWPWCAERRARQGDELVVECDARLDIEAVLAVRDLTIHAMARDTEGNLIDPHDGMTDLHDGFLRHVTPHFARHPEYVLRVAEAAAELVHWGFRVAHGTYGLMKKMINAQWATALGAEVRAQSVTRALSSHTPSEYFRVLHRCGALHELAPALEAVYQPAGSHSASETKPALFEMLDARCAEGENGRAVFHALMQAQAPPILDAFGLRD